MSLNIFLSASLDAETKLGKTKITEVCDLWQTPTKVTKNILNAENKLNEYKKWVTSLKNNYGNDHIKEVEKWLELYKEWDIEWSLI